MVQTLGPAFQPTITIPQLMFITRALGARCISFFLSLIPGQYPQPCGLSVHALVFLQSLVSFFDCLFVSSLITLSYQAFSSRARYITYLAASL